MTLALAAGAPLADAARLANRAAGIVVGKFGPATVTADELRGSLETTVGRREDLALLICFRCHHHSGL